MKWTDRWKTWDTLAILLIVVAPWLVFWQAAVGVLAFAGGDVSSFFYPVRLELAQALSQNRLPLWAPGADAGFPLFAEGQVGALYVPNLLLFRWLPVFLGINHSILFHLSWAAVGMYLFARSSGLQTSSAALAGFAFEFSGFFFAHLQHLSLIATAAWLGWMLYFLHLSQSSWRRGDRRWMLFFALTGSAIGMQFLSGFPQIAFLNLIAFVLVGLLGAFTARGERGAWRPLLMTLGCVILGSAIGALQLIPTAELATLSLRGQVGQEFFTSYSLEYGDLVQFVSPYLALGQPISDTQEFWGFVGIGILGLGLSAILVKRNARTWLLVAIAAFALALALGANTPIYGALYAVPVFNRFRVPARFLFLFAFAIITLAAIAFDELQSRLDDSVGSARQALIAGLFFCALVGAIAYLKIAMPVDAWVNGLMTLPWVFAIGLLALLALAWRRAAARALFVAGVLGLVVVEMLALIVPFLFTLDAIVPPTMLTNVPEVIRGMDPTNSLYRIWTNNYSQPLRPNRLMAYGKPSPQVYSPLALGRNDDYMNLLSAGMLNLMGIRYVMQADTIPDNANVPPSTLRADVTSEPLTFSPMQVTRVEIVSYTSGTQGIDAGALVAQLGLNVPNSVPVVLPIRVGTDTAEWNFDSLAANGQARHGKPPNSLPFVANLATASDDKGLKFIATYDLPSPPPLVSGISVSSRLRPGMLAVDSVTLFDRNGKGVSAASLAGQINYSLAYIDPGVALDENRDALPRAFVVHQTEIAADDRILDLMQEPTFQPSRIAYLSDGDAINFAPDAGLVGDEVSVVEYQPERVVVRARTPVAGYLVLADSWYPGWTASVDGRAAQIDRADYIFRAVKLTAGDHQIVFEYHPASLLWGSLVSLAGVLAMVAFAAFGLKGGGV